MAESFPAPDTQFVRRLDEEHPLSDQSGALSCAVHQSVHSHLVQDTTPPPADALQCLRYLKTALMAESCERLGPNLLLHRWFYRPRGDSSHPAWSKH
ncbi:Uncharacterised protein [Vibrio cholerae]|nr:Uncharacterised protein [Vibrio cholerae]CSI63605.1 Uncharacterised protein [Vibrio cholerae]